MCQDTDYSFHLEGRCGTEGHLGKDPTNNCCSKGEGRDVHHADNGMFLKGITTY